MRIAANTSANLAPRVRSMIRRVIMRTTAHSVSARDMGITATNGLCSDNKRLHITTKHDK